MWELLPPCQSIFTHPPPGIYELPTLIDLRFRELTDSVDSSMRPLDVSSLRFPLHVWIVFPTGDGGQAAVAALGHTHPFWERLAWFHALGLWFFVAFVIFN